MGKFRTIKVFSNKYLTNEKKAVKIGIATQLNKLGIYYQSKKVGWHYLISMVVYAGTTLKEKR